MNLFQLASYDDVMLEHKN